ncbi:SAM-dependent methyltransferase [Azospirillum soli]|uniref:SAM-dependent methyltransferase n=1 Tax=Azospirillum soli TaxID=1304799 RepID=UPI001AE89D2D|nr:class I SAM-dependent methyltransferase [Azospirillum soli]MBP2316477.1 SAM-dependent methyltransferase [Azospirillum soli]
MERLNAQELVARYKRKFGLAPSYPLSESMVLQHWDLERRLARELLDSRREERWSVFERCYTALYSACPWLNDAVDTSVQDDQLDFGHFLTLLKGATDVYEVGSGKARLLGFLARHGYRCVATEVTRERGERWIDERTNVTWRCCDGVNLAEFEPKEQYDAVVSTHVIEHFHPDDVIPHMENVHAILKPGGRYVLSMPHKHAGPMDLSEVFGLDEPICMHLREYTWAETEAALRKAGFERMEAVYIAPMSVRRRLPIHFSGRGYLAYVKAVEALLGAMPLTMRRKLGKLGQLYLFRPEVFMVAHKAR